MWANRLWLKCSPRMSTARISSSTSTRQARCERSQCGAEPVGGTGLLHDVCYEINFLLSRGNKLCPLEVKSSGYKTHASLDAFQMRFSERILHRYLVYTKNLAKDQDVLMLPVFMVSLI